MAGIDSRFFYGYSSGARCSSEEASVAGAVHLTSRHRVMFNYALHKLTGLEFLPPTGSGAESLKQAIREVDVVHLHVTHSYFMPFGWLSDALKGAKKIVWTCHDYWPITGRCGFLEGCEGWKGGCGVCDTGLNYPPAFLDFSAYSFKKKRELIRRHLDKIVFAAPSQFVRDQYRQAFPLARVETVYNGIDADLERAVLSVDSKKEAKQDGITRILVMANDLADPTKVDRCLINEVVSLPGLELHTIGKNSPFHQDGVKNHGEIRVRADLVAVMRGIDALLFTSLKDTFGLVMIEAMVCGVPVLALPSDAADEVLGLVGQHSLVRQRIVQLLSDPVSRIGDLRDLKMQLVGCSLEIFSGRNMFEQYLKIYGTA
jgi:putative colanic acid biosynthesis glycosyltransferase